MDFFLEKLHNVTNFKTFFCGSRLSASEYCNVTEFTWHSSSLYEYNFSFIESKFED